MSFEAAGSPNPEVNTQVAGGSNTQTSAGQVAEPSVIDLDENALIRIKGQEKPVKFGEYSRGFQSQLTKASQEAARVKRELEQRQAQLEQYERERQLAAQRNQNQGGQVDVFQQLRALPYLSGEDAVSMVQSIGQEIKQRDMILVKALQKIQALDRIVSGLHETSTTSAFDAKIAKFLQDGGFDREYTDFAKELYLAYEGDDLDSEFPRILADRMQQLERLITAKREREVREARGNPFVPGRGGNAHPSKPLQLRPDASPKETVDALWDSMQAASET